MSKVATFSIALPKIIFPHSYIPPLGEPYHWECEESGILADAIATWGEGRDISSIQYRILKAYILHWLFAPCWRPSDLYDLRLGAMAMTNISEMESILNRAFKLGIKPW
jgi:hypothetical protein